MKRFALVLTALALILSVASVPASAAGGPYPDMPEQEWAVEAVLKAREYGLMEGGADGAFGTGRDMARQEFVTVLCRMMGWPQKPGGNAFDDIGASWGAGYINAAASHGAVDAGGDFRPDDPITRREMAVMLVRALGLSDIAKQDLPLPFSDVTEDAGYIAVAYDIRMTNGTSPSTFGPEEHAAREQAAAMLVRVYERYRSDTSWAHGFYAISSYGQIELAKKLDAVTLSWSRMTYVDGSAKLNTTDKDNNEYRIPSGWEGAVNELREAGVKMHLGVFMTDSGSALSALLADSAQTDAAIDEIVDTVKYLGLSGVTVDFEGLYSPSKDSFTSFVSRLDSALEAQGMTLFVTVMPATADGVYYDGYDYSKIGEAADKVILMAHDYAPIRMDESLLGSEFYKNSALTPIASVYWSLRAVCDQQTGVRDLSKVAVNLSMDAGAWETDENGRLISAAPIHPSVDTVYSRLSSGAVMGWSETYKNPYLTYTTESGQHIFLWYEDERSVEAKLSLAHLLGVTSLSVWRLGQIPSHPDEGLYYNIADILPAK